MSPVGSPLSKIASPHRMQLRSSPAPAIQAKSPARALNDRLHAAQIEAASTTPKGSPTPAGSRSILQQLGQAVDRPPVAVAPAPEPVYEAELSIRQVAPATIELLAAGKMDDDEGQFSDHEPRPSLPPQLATSEHGDQSQGEDGDDEEDEAAVVVEKGRGALVSAMEVEQDATTITVLNAELTASDSKAVMPGTFGGDDLEEEADGDLSVEIMDPANKVSCAIFEYERRI